MCIMDAGELAHGSEGAQSKKRSAWDCSNGKRKPDRALCRLAQARPCGEYAYHCYATRRCASPLAHARSKRDYGGNIIRSSRPKEEETREKGEKAGRKEIRHFNEWGIEICEVGEEVDIPTSHRSSVQKNESDKYRDKATEVAKEKEENALKAAKEKEDLS